MGLVGTVSGGIAGIVLTQRKADQREKDAWDRQREREREQWARDDEARTFEHRREAYIDFYSGVKVLERGAYELTKENSTASEYKDSPVEAYKNLQRLEFYANRDLMAAAWKTFTAVSDLVGKRGSNKLENVSERDIARRYERHQAEMLRLMRSALSIPEEQ
jgi:hypothetical protein